MINQMKKKIQESYEIEASTVQRLTDAISDIIMSNLPITNQWLLANDALVYMSDKRIIPEDDPYPVPDVVDIYSNKLNDEQKQMLTSWINSIKLGDVVLEQDVRELLDKSLNGVGPLTSESISNTLTNSTLKLCPFTVPSYWRSTFNEPKLRDLILTCEQSRPGTDEHSGVISVNDIISKFNSLTDY